MGFEDETVHSFLFSEPWLVLSLCANNVSLRRAESALKSKGIMIKSLDISVRPYPLADY